MGYFYNKNLGFYDGVKIKDDMEVTEEDFNLYKDRLVNYKNNVFSIDEEKELERFENKFRTLRNSYLEKCDIAINIAEDNNQDTTQLRALRQALRDATIDWNMPDVSILE